MKQSKKTAVVLGAIVLILGAVGIGLRGASHPAGDPSGSENIQAAASSAERGGLSGDSSAGTSAAAGSSVQSAVSTPTNSGRDAGNAAEQTLHFPYTIPNTGLVIERLDGYDGVYLEDGTDAEITGVTAMVLKNTLKQDIEYAGIHLYGEETTLQFTASAIPAGATVIVQEQTKTPYHNRSYTACTADVTEPGKLEQSAQQIQITENGEQSLTVTNLTDAPIACVRVFYKFYMEEEQAYVGGITYNAKLTNLAAGSSQTISPSHYASGYSRVVMVRTYEADESGAAVE